MAEYDSFHYLMHKVDPGVKATYVSGPKPLQFEELYSPRDSEPRPIGKAEKSYWRTRERIEYSFYENRKQRVMIITCRSIEANDVFRTIFLDLAALYFELEFKLKGDREVYTKKKDKKLVDDAALHKAAIDYILARLNIQKDPLPWPDFSNTVTNIAEKVITTTSTEIAAPTIGNEETIITPSQIEQPAALLPILPLERMCMFDILSGDGNANIEIEYSTNILIEGLLHIKVSPTAVNQNTPNSSASSESEGGVSDSSSNSTQTNSLETTLPAAPIIPTEPAPKTKGATAGGTQVLTNIKKKPSPSAKAPPGKKIVPG